jgi:hypothetical protein
MAASIVNTRSETVEAFLGRGFYKNLAHFEHDCPTGTVTKKARLSVYVFLRRDDSKVPVPLWWRLLPIGHSRVMSTCTISWNSATYFLLCNKFIPTNMEHNGKIVWVMFTLGEAVISFGQ